MVACKSTARCSMLSCTTNYFRLRLISPCLSKLIRSTFPCPLANSPATVPDWSGVTPNYLGVSPRFASSCTDFVVADLSIVDLVDRPQADGGFVICLANIR